MTKSNESRLRQIATMTNAELTDADRQLVKEQSEKMGLTFEPENTGCQKCYSDQAILILSELKKEKANTEKSDRKYVLRDNIDCIFKGMRINNDTLTDEMAEALLEQGFEPSFFVGYEGQH